MIPLLALFLFAQSSTAQSPPPIEEEIIARVGGDVTAPKVIRTVAPKLSGAGPWKYGKVVCKMIIGKDGRPRSIEAVSAVDSTTFRDIVAALRKWVFEPATKNGEPVAVRVAVEVSINDSNDAGDIAEWDAIAPKPWEIAVCKKYADDGQFVNAAEGSPEKQMRIACAQAAYYRDHKAAVEPLKAAAQAGLVDAQSYLAAVYWYGMGTKRNKREALRWAKIANSLGAQFAEPAMSVMVQEMKDKEIVKATKSAEEWLAAWKQTHP